MAFNIGLSDSDMKLDNEAPVQMSHAIGYRSHECRGGLFTALSLKN
jgi:hypothetical protein